MGRSPLLGAPPLPSPSAPSPPQPGWGTWASLPGILAQPRSPGHDAGIEGVPYSKANKLRFAATDLLVVTPRRHLTKMVFAAVRVRQCSGSCSPAFQPAWRALVRQWPCMLPTAEPADQGLRSGDRRVRCPVGRLCRDWCPVHDSGTADGGGGREVRGSRLEVLRAWLELEDVRASRRGRIPMGWHVAEEYWSRLASNLRGPAWASCTPTPSCSAAIAAV